MISICQLSLPLRQPYHIVATILIQSWLLLSSQSRDCLVEIGFDACPRISKHGIEALRSCDLFLSIGTSGTVYPASQIVIFAKDAGAETHQFNNELADGSHRFYTCHVGEAGEMLPKFVDELIGEQPVGWNLTPEQKAAKKE